MKSWKSSSLPLCGVAVISRKWRVRRPRAACRAGSAWSPSPRRRSSAPTSCAPRRTTMRSQSRRRQLRLHVLVARELVEARDDAGAFSANGLPVREASILSRVRISNVEVELGVQLVLPLLDQAARATIRQRCEVAADDQLLDEQPGHDRLAGAGVVGEQEAQRLARQHLAVDGRDLVRQRSSVEVWTARYGSNRWAGDIRLASDTSRKSSPSASNDHARPVFSTVSRASSSRSSSSWAALPVSSSVKVRVTALEPCQAMSTTLTTRSPRIPRTRAPLVRSSSRAMDNNHPRHLPLNDARPFPRPPSAPDQA